MFMGHMRIFANNNGRMTARKSSRRPRRSNTMNVQSNKISNHTSKVIRGMPNPVPVATDLLTMRRFEAIVTSAGTGAFTVSPKALIDTIPGTSTLWDKVRFHRIDIFSSMTNTLGAYMPIVATLNNPASGYFGDVPTGYSDPIGNFRRAHVGFVPAQLFQMTWIDSSDTSPLLTIQSAGSSSSGALVQFVCTLRTTAGSPTLEPVESVVESAVLWGDS